MTVNVDTRPISKAGKRIGRRPTRNEPVAPFNIRMGQSCKRMLDGFCVLTERKQWEVTEAALRRYIVTEGLRMKNNGHVGLGVLNDGGEQ